MILGEETKKKVKTAKKIKINRTAHKELVTYDLLNVMSLLKDVDWINNPDNEYNCGRCKHNVDSDTNLPCGQQNCWVTCHINSNFRYQF